VASRAVDEALEAECATEYAARYLRKALADGEITRDEALEAVRLIEHALKEARDVVPLAEQACQLAVIGSQFVLYGEPTARSAAIAATVGIEPPHYDTAA
jgi:hypothetical protein